MSETVDYYTYAKEMRRAVKAENEINKMESITRGLVKQVFELGEAKKILEKEADDLTADNVRQKSRVKVLLVELAHYKAGGSRLNFKGGE